MSGAREYFTLAKQSLETASELDVSNIIIKAPKKMFKDIVRIMKGGLSFLHYDLMENIKRWLQYFKHKKPSWYTQCID
jgi:hypothetical protein